MFGVFRTVLFIELVNLVVIFTLELAKSENDFVDIDIPNLGKVRGKVGYSFFTRRPVYQFLGINYAKSPSKERRFKPPEKFEPWGSTGLYDATKMRQSCPQPQLKFYPSPSPDQLDIKDDIEDCLVVNVFTPEIDAKQNKLSPVIFYTHGGSFYAGSTYDFPPDFLLEEDVVLVVVQYRLGILGFLSLDTDEIPGNFGMLDIIMALNWVKDNIKAFGGDPNNLTVMGQSAGAAATSSLLVSPLVPHGLFQKMIIQSGSVLSPWAVDEQPVKSAIILAEYLGCPWKDIPGMVKCFKEGKIEDLITAHGRLEVQNSAGCATSLVVQNAGSHKYLVEHPKEVFSRSDFQKVPILGGVTREEGSSFVAVFHMDYGLNKLKDATYYKRNVTRDILKFCGDFPKDLEIMTDYFYNFYFKNKKTSNFLNVVPGLVDICGALLLKGSTYDLLRTVSSHMPTYLYSFNFFGNVSKFRGSDSSWSEHDPFNAGVAHSDELGYLFPSYRFNYTQRELKMVKKMTKYWTNFVKTGKPSEDWPTMSTFFGPYMRISDKDEIRKNFFDEYVVTSTEGFLESSGATATRPFILFSLFIAIFIIFVCKI